MKKYITIICFLLIILFSCKNENVINIELAKENIFINPMSVSKDRINYSDWFEKIDYITLPTDSNFLIGSIDKLLVTDDYLFVMDQKISRSVSSIDRNGNVKLSLSKTGNGPGEYMLMTDISFDSKQEEVLIHCKVKQKILYYDLDGNFLREQKIPYRVRKIYPISDNTFAFYCEYYDNPKLHKLSNSPNLLLANLAPPSIIEKTAYFEPPIDQSVVWNANCQFSFWGDTLSIKPDHHNTIYHITKDGIYPVYTLDFGSYNIDSKYWNQVKQRGITLEKINAYSNESGLCESYRFLESSNYIYFVYKQKGKIYFVLYSKKTKTLRHTETFQNDMDMVTLFRPIAVHDDKFYCLLESEDVYRMREHLKGAIPDEILDNVQEFGNPIIAIFTLKPF